MRTIITEVVIDFIGHVSLWLLGVVVLTGDSWLEFSVRHGDGFVKSMYERILTTILPTGGHAGNTDHLLVLGDYILIDVLTSVTLIVSIIMMTTWTYSDISKLISRLGRKRRGKEVRDKNGRRLRSSDRRTYDANGDETVRRVSDDESDDMIERRVKVGDRRTE